VAHLLVATDCPAWGTAAAEQSRSNDEDWHDSEQKNRKHVPIVAKVLILRLFKIVTLAQEPCPHASNALLVLEAIRLEPSLTSVALHTGLVVLVLIAANRHQL